MTRYKFLETEIFDQHWAEDSSVDWRYIGAVLVHGPIQKPETVVMPCGERTGGCGSLMGPKVKQAIESYFALRNALKDVLDKNLRDDKKLNQ